MPGNWGKKKMVSVFIKPTGLSNWDQLKGLAIQKHRA